MKQLPAQPNQSLMDGLACLQAVATTASPRGSRELARQLGMEPTRVNRLLKTLAHLGLTTQDAKKKYAAGPAIHILSAQTLFASGLLRQALPALRALQQLNGVVALGVLWRDQVSYLCHALPDHPIEEGIGRLGVFPATQSSIGLVLLAQKPDAEIRSLFQGKKIPRYGADVTHLIKDLHIVRAQGYARVDEATGITSLAVPVGANPSSAIAVSGTAIRRNFTSAFDLLAKSVAGVGQCVPRATLQRLPSLQRTSRRHRTQR